MRDTPVWLNRWRVIAIAVAIIFAVVTAIQLGVAWQANRAAADDVEQLIRVQNMQSHLFRADALATNAFLIGGLEPPEQRQQYDDSLRRVSALVAEAAAAQPADRQALAALNVAVTSYAESMMQARANNRQGFPVGAQYLRDASTELRATALPIVTNLVTANEDRTEAEMTAHHPLLVALPGLVALAILGWVNHRIAQRFHRRVNIGLVGSAVVIGVLTLVATGVSWGQSRANAQLLDGEYARATAAASARTAANDAKANESLALVSRGSGQAFRDAWDEASAAAEASRSKLAFAGAAEWTAYLQKHFEIMGLDDSGDWDGAVEKATAEGPDSATAAFDAFDAAMQRTVDDNVQATTNELRSGNFGILILGLVCLGSGLAAAGASSWGINQRRKEYE